MTVQVTGGSFSEGQSCALFGRAFRLRRHFHVKPRRLTGFRPLIEAGRSWQDALKVER
jgi:hypothetical protein